MHERERQARTFGLRALLLTALLILAFNCQAHYDSGSSPDQTSPAPAQAPTASADQTPSATVSLYEFQPVGEYRLIQIGPDGASQYVLFQRTVSQFRAGEADASSWQDLATLVESQDFERLQPGYDLPPSKPGAPAVVYEDTYYRLTVTRAGGSKEVLAHEHAAPTLLKEIVTRLVALGRKLPEQPRSGLFLLALDPAMADQIRWLRGKKAEAPSGDAAPSRLPVVAQALSRPGWLFPVPSTESPEVLRTFSGDTRRLDLVHGEKKLAVCLLRGTENQ